MSTRLSWDDQRTFLAVFEEGSLSGAARRLGLSHATVRSRIEALEAALGAVLFTRSAAGLLPTDSARALHEPARAMALASEQFIRLAAAPPGEIAGVVRISVSEFMGIEVLPAMLGALRLRYPALGIELALSNAPADVLGREVDIAVRTVAPRQEALVARRVAGIALGFFASPLYIERHGAPASLAELAGHDLIGSDRNATDLAMAETLGLPRNRFVLRTDSHPAQLAAARAGLGIAVAQVPTGAGDGRLRRVLPDEVPGSLDIWLVTHADLRATPKVRVVLDSLAEAFAGYGVAA